MRAGRFVALSAAGIALVASSVVATTGVAVAKSASKSAACSVVTDDHWPSWVQGRPSDIDPHTTDAIYMWHDSGWHIRVTHHKTNLRTFSGQLATRGSFTDVRPVHLEKSDQLQVSRDRHSITFFFKNFGLIDGLDFHTRCAPSIVFAFQSDGRTAPPDKIVIGHNGVHPRTDPFTISRNSTGPTHT